MTDKEIIQTLEKCSSSSCDDCYYCKSGIPCLNLYRQARDLIKRQQAELEQKNKQIEELVDFQRFCKKKAIKEFAKTLQEDVEYHIDEIGEFVPYIRVSDIQRVTKEMVDAGK